MNHPNRRAYPRADFHLPIQYRPTQSDRYRDSELYNISEAGLAFGSMNPLTPGTRVRVFMIKCPEITPGPGAYHAFVVGVRWCRDSIDGDALRYSVGAEILEKLAKEEAMTEPAVQYTCDLCGAVRPEEEMIMTDGVWLCRRCHAHLERLPAGNLRDCIDRFLMGNVC